MSGEYTTKIEGDIGIKKLEDVLWHIQQII
jgi:hypothetical protein